MRTSDLVVAAIALLVPFAIATGGCLDGSTCLRNSDCPAVDICSVGACILAPVDTGEGGTDEGGAEASVVPPTDSGTVTPDGGDSGNDATVSDAAKDGGDGSADGSTDGPTDGSPDDAADAATD
jgi:hypothetical protein